MHALSSFATPGFLFLYPGLLLMSLVGLGAANFLKDPSPAVKAAVAGAPRYSWARSTGMRTD